MELVPQLLAVAGVLTLFGATLWWLRRRGFAAVLQSKRGSTRRMECLERLPLSPQHTLHMVRMGRTVLVVSSSPAGCSLVQSVPAGEIDCQ
jgi:flagellar biogenesis protein FliO